MSRLRRALSLTWEAPQSLLGAALLGVEGLPIIGLPSISRAGYALLYREITGRTWTGYYEGYPEKWADRLGGVDRKRT